MKKWMKQIALVAAMTMMVCGCSSAQPAAETTAAETTAAETEAAVETEAVEETETAAEEQLTVEFSNGLDEEGRLIDLSVTEKVTLPDYKNASFAKDAVTASADEIQEGIDSIMANFEETVEVMDREVKDGDTINLDYVGSVDGVEFEGGSTQGNGADLVIGSHSYIDTFEEQLIGHKPGDHVTVNVTFPENYGKDELNGKAAVFECTINSIKEKVTPELTDAFVAEKLKDAYGVDSVAALNAEVESKLTENKEYVEVWKWLLENTTFEAEPESVAEMLLDNYMDANRVYAQNNGVTMEQYLTYVGMESEDALREYYREDAMESAKKYVITQMISDADQIEVDDAVMTEYFEGEDSSSYVDFYGIGYVKMQIRYSEIVELVMKTAQVQ